MSGFRLSRRAVDDLRAIARHTERQWGRDQRNRYLRELDRCFHQLADHPRLGPPREDIRSGYRQHRHASHVIFCQLSRDETVDIIRILHKHMLPDDRLEE